jgi:acetyl-CoA acyltransferase
MGNSASHIIKPEKKRRAAIVAGLRTPFAKSGAQLRHLQAVELACACVAELCGRNNLDPQTVQRLIYGQVVVDPAVPNIAREVVLGAGLPVSIDAYSVSRACATSTQALVEAAAAIESGDIDVAICGGADSLSRPPITYQDRFVEALMQANAARDALSKARPFLRLRPKDWLPKAPGLQEACTGLSMGESAEKMARDNGIDRAAQDAFAARSHQRAAAAWEQGIFAEEVMHLPLGVRNGGVPQTMSRDAVVRADTSLDKLQKLRPAFDKKYGSITAGSSSPLTDGAAALLVMEESRAAELGFEPLAFVKSWAFSAVDPAWQLLMAPALAIPRALQRAQLTLQDMTFVDMHEAFAAQVLSNLQALASDAFCAEHSPGLPTPGTIDPERLNIYGGSIALGHPFAATGARQALTMAHALKRRGHGTALISQCAAGGLGAALILERPAH